MSSQNQQPAAENPHPGPARENPQLQVASTVRGEEINEKYRGLSTVGLILAAVVCIAPILGVFLLFLADAGTSNEGSTALGFSGLALMMLSFFGSFVSVPLNLVIGMVCRSSNSSRVRRRGLTMWALQLVTMAVLVALYINFT